jgi:hypothetical protein
VSGSHAKPIGEDHASSSIVSSRSSTVVVVEAGAARYDGKNEMRREMINNET